MTVKPQTIALVTLLLPIIVFAQTGQVISTDKLPDMKAPSVPPAVDKVRIDTLISQIPSLTDLNNIYVEDLNKFEVQNAIVNSNPILVSKLPRNVVLHEKPMKFLAEKFYRFDYFIPVYLRGQKSVQESFKKYAKDYTKDFAKYLVTATRYLHEGKGTALIHPDFFYDSTFTYVYEMTCASFYQSYNYSPHIPPEIAMRMNMGRTELKENPDRKMTFEFINAIGTFTNQQKDLFLAKHPPTPLPITCYPADFLIDKDFILAMNTKFPNSNFLETSYNLTKNAALKDAYIDKVIKKITSDYNFPASLRDIKPDDWQSPKMQAWIFENPAVLKEMNPNIKLDKTLLENFVKTQYRPERFFSEAQKLNPEIAEILKKYPNTDAELMKAGKELAIKELGSIRCCGPSYSRGQNQMVESWPSEFLEDSDFLIEGLKKLRGSDDYLKALSKRKAITNKLKDYIVENSNDVFAACSWVGSNHGPDFFKTDEEFVKKMKKVCKKE